MTLNFIRYLDMLFDIPEVTIDGSTMVLVSHPQYFENLDELLGKTDER